MGVGVGVGVGEGETILPDILKNKIMLFVCCRYDGENCVWPW